MAGGEGRGLVVDRETNYVCVSDLLAGRFPSVFKAMGRILSEHGIGFGVASGTRDIWLRDFTPVQVVRDGSFVLFRYFLDYLRQRDQDLITDARELNSDFPGSGVASIPRSIWTAGTWSGTTTRPS